MLGALLLEADQEDAERLDVGRDDLVQAPGRGEGGRSGQGKREGDGASADGIPAHDLFLPSRFMAGARARGWSVVLPL